MARGLRIATFNLENLDDAPGLDPPLAARLDVLRPQLARLRADILCLQEVNGQAAGKGKPRELRALDKLLAGTPYEAHARIASHGPSGAVADRHNLVILSALPILESRQYWHDFVPPPDWRPVTAMPAAESAEPVRWDRPILHAALDLGGGGRLDILNLHLRSPMPAYVAGQKEDSHTWKTVSGWAEGSFLATVKRAGQALEARLVIDRLFDFHASAHSDALIAICGDFNATAREGPVAQIRGDEEDTGNGRLAMRVLVPLEETIAAERRFSVRHHGEAAMLDHILVSRRLLGYFRRSEVHNETLGDELVAFATVRHSPESYHAPVITEFELPDF